MSEEEASASSAHRRIGPRGLAAAVALAVSVSGCGTPADGDASGDQDDQDDREVGLVALLNENSRLRTELDEAESRIEQACLEDLGFDVHNRYTLAAWEADDADRLVEHYPFEGFLPGADIASRWGFGVWATTGQGWESDEAEDYRDTVYGEDRADEEPDNSEWDALSAEERKAWKQAYYGEDYAWAEGGAMGMAPEENAQDLPPPKPGGCRLTMIEALYGGPEQVERAGAEGEQGRTVWEWGPKNPLDEGDWEAMTADYRTAVADEGSAFLDCLAGNGLGEWEFDESAALPVWVYFTWVYNAESPQFAGESADALGTPELPADLPADFEGRKDLEVATAVGFAECGDSTGYREAATALWDQIQTDYYLSIESELWSYQEQMRELLDKAQDLIGD